MNSISIFTIVELKQIKAWVSLEESIFHGVVRYETMKNWPNPLVKIIFWGRLNNVPKHVLWTSPYGPPCNTKGRLLPISWRHTLPTSFGRWNITSWGSPQNVLYVTPGDVPFRCLEYVSCRCYQDVRILSNM